VTASAPRYDGRLLDAIARVDDLAVPIAETVRRLAYRAEELGVPRPSYVHMRRYVVAHRERERAARARREGIRQILLDAYFDATTGKRVVNAYELAERLKDAGA
jgi:hypothetical protein